MNRRWACLVTAVITMVCAQVLNAPPGGTAPTPKRGLDRAVTPFDRTSGPTSKPRDLKPAIRTPAGRPIARPADIARTASPAAAAHGYLKRYGASFELPDPARQTRLARVSAMGGGHAVRVQQLTEGLPVIGGELVVTIDGANNLVSITGETSALAPRSSAPAVSATDAAGSALDRVARAEQVSASSLRASTPELSVYDASLLGPGSSVARLVWQMEVGNGLDVRHYTLVDAHRGAVALDFSMINEAKELHVCDKANVRSSNDLCPGAGDRALVDGVDSGALLPGTDPGRASDVNAAFDNSAGFYDFLASQVGLDSLDGNGLTLRSSVRYCGTTGPCPYANAYWNGAQMVYGAGFSRADDVVGHELAHGVTEFGPGLLYYYQSGAINESISDVFGELFDQQVDRAGTDALATKWQLGEDLPLPPGGPPGSQIVRDMAHPELHDQPDSMTSPLYDADAAFTDNGGVHTNSGVGNKAAVLLTDGGTHNGTTVGGIGPDKTMDVWYAATKLLTSGSDYADLAVALAQGCTTLVGGPSGVTAANCIQVANASSAVQMSVDPPAAPTTPAPVCPTGASKTTMWSDSFEADWSWSVYNWMPDDLLNPAGWSLIEGYASEGKRAMMADDTSEKQWSSAVPRDNATGGDRRFSVPSDGRQTYLRFDHAYDLEAGYDGAKVEYWTDSPNTEPKDVGVDLPAGAVDHPYNGQISMHYDSEIAGQWAFTGWSNGYTSTRVNLTSIGGKPFTPIFTSATDTGGPGLGWFIDNVEVYTCTLGRTSTSITAPTSLTAGGSATIGGRMMKSGTSTGLSSLPVRLEQRKKGTSTWSLLATKTSSSTGGLSATVKPTASTDYRWRFLGKNGWIAGISPTKQVQIRPAISKTVNDSTIALRRSFTVSGRVLPRMDGQSIKLQRYYRGGWHTVKSATLGRYDATRSKYAMTYVPPVRGALRFRIYKAPDASHLGNAVAFTVTVR